MSNHAYIRSRHRLHYVDVICKIIEINNDLFKNKFEIRAQHNIKLCYQGEVFQEIFFRREGFARNQIVMPWPDGIWQTYVHVALKHQMASELIGYIADESHNNTLQPDPVKYASGIRNWLKMKYNFAGLKSKRAELIKTDLLYVPKELRDL